MSETEIRERWAAATPDSIVLRSELAAHTDDPTKE